MKICLLSNALSIHTRRWMNWLKENSHEVHLISYRYGEIRGADFTCFPLDSDNCLCKSFHFLNTLREIRRRIWEIKPDILHAHYITSYGLLGILSRYKPLIASAWGSDLFVDSKKSFLHRYIIKRVIKKADLITVMANHMLPRVRELGGDIGKTIKVTLGVNIEKFNINGRKTNYGKTVIISNRVFEKEQNIQYIINSLPYLISKRDDTEIRFYGDGSLRGHCENLVKRLGIQSNVNFFGIVDHDRMADCLKQAHVYVSTSTSEGDHVSLMEAMACGLFPVVSDIPANREWVENGKNGFLVPLNDGKCFAQKIIEAIEKQTLREKAEKYNFELVKSRVGLGNDLKLLEEYYKKLCRKI